MHSKALCSDPSSALHTNATDYLRVEQYIADFVTAQALYTALKIDLIDAVGYKPHSETMLNRAYPEYEACPMLLQQLQAAGITTQEEGYWKLSEEFKKCLPYKDLLLAKLEFANLLAPDLLQHYELFLKDLPAFIQQAKVFELFAYDRCFEVTEDNIQATRNWMRFTTSLTRYEGRVIAKQVDLKGSLKHLDIGGNSGEFALQLCKANPELRSTVVDLPVVCEVGKQHLCDEPEANRIRFFAADALTDPLPMQQDLVTFKSILHDWPIPACERFISRAAETLTPEGQIIICERGPLNLKKPVPYGLLPMLLFNRSFRSAEQYQKILHDQGFKNCSIQQFELETPFFMVIAKRN